MRLTASKRALFDACLWPFAEGRDVPYDPPGPPALLGTAVHAAIEAWIRGVDLPVCPEDVDAGVARTIFVRWQDWYAGWDAARSWRWKRVEVPYAIDVATGAARELPSGGQRDYTAATPTEIVGTADFVGLLADGALVVRDWKTSARGLWNLRDATPQLRTLALMAARVHGVDTVDVGSVHIAPTGVQERAFALDALDLDADQDTIAGRLAMVEGAAPVVSEACRYCAARTVCPAQRGDAAETTDGGALAVLERPGALTVEAVAKAYVQLRIIKGRVEAAERRIRAEVEARGVIPVGGGKVLAIVEAHRENLSKSSIVKALGEDAGPLLDKLREAGALTVTNYKRMEETNEKKGRVA